MHPQLEKRDLRAPTWRQVGIGAGICVVVCSSAARAGSDYFQPRGTEYLVNDGTNFAQTWTRVSIADDASVVAFSYNNGQDPFARQFRIDGVPLMPSVTCTPTLNLQTQDENETALANDGRQLIAWSERHGYDGEQMGIYGRILLPGGAPAGQEFQINQIWQASQWRPLIAARPSGGWIVAWSGDWDGDPLFRVVASDGTMLSNDISVSTYDNGGQTDTAPAMASDGTMLVVFVDYSGHGGIGTGTNLWGRLFNENGVALQASEFPLTTAAYSVADQREPRAVADGLGNFIVTWEDAQKDGFTWGIFARRFAHNGTPLGAEFRVNTTILGAQRNPRVAADALGNFIVVWEDSSAGHTDIRAQRYDPSAAPVGAEFVVNSLTLGDQRRPSLAMTPATGDVVFTFDGPGNSTDAWARAYEMYEPPTAYCTAKTNSLGCEPQIGSSGTPTLSGADDFHVLASLVRNNKHGIAFWSGAPAANPFYGGTLCVAPPATRTPVQLSGGSVSGDDCSGAYDFHFTHAYMSAHALIAGSKVHVQWWSRDAGFPTPQQNIGLTNGLRFDVKP